MQTATIAFDHFNQLQDDACHERIRAARARLGQRAVILGHHYQRADVYQYADLTGDSLKLSRLASQTDAEFIVFCGVHFMAEVADFMTKPHQKANLPDLSAGWSMADILLFIHMVHGVVVGQPDRADAPAAVDRALTLIDPRLAS